MLIDIKRKTIFVAGLKTASTSIEHRLSPHADIRLTRSEWGKHDSVAQIQAKFDWLFLEEPWETFFAWAVIRDPIDMMRSLYWSHKREDFAAEPTLYTGGMDFDTFLDEWTELNSDQCRPQSDRFMTAQGRYGLDLLLPYDMLHDALPLVAPRYGLREILLPRMNVSAQVAESADAPDRTEATSGTVGHSDTSRGCPDQEVTKRIEARFHRDVALLKHARNHVTHLLDKMAEDMETNRDAPEGP